MTIARISPQKARQKNRFRLWFERTMAILALINYMLVIFNLTYIPLRDFWLQGRVQLFFKFGQYELEWPPEPVRVLPVGLSQFITQYDVFKGIEPYRTTEQYLETVEKLKKEVSLEGLNTNNENVDKILQTLQQESLEMINNNPFEVANKLGTFERIKNKMRDYVFGTGNASAKQAFLIFWSRDYLKNNYSDKINFFDEQIVPLLQTNYYRPVGENGEPVDNFGLIDFFFFMIFLPEFLIRTWLISRRYTGVSWRDAMLWRWYDIFLLIPFFKILRIIPVIIRLNQSDLIDLNSIKKQASQGFVAGIAEDITEVVFIRIINQIQNSVKQGDIQKILTHQTTSTYIDVNEINEIQEIVKLFLEIIVEKTLPQIQPEAEAFLKYNFDKAISQSPAFTSLQRFPGVEGLQNQLSQQLASRSYQTLCEVMNSLIKEDKKFNELLGKMIQKFSLSLGTELQVQKSTDKLELLITDLLEEIKINYIERLSQEDVDAILEQTRQLRQKAQATLPQIEPSPYR
ncbi:conserved hypothetical protein [Gloeothece citriformis PCC 7424]|uniref:Uncharacterized protein n=1 Tax=Gloeothece citriformis (strain PCC 7424) TaxID=65393 RepID=B7KIU6_GLOC7|nr:hypothetical protein [Gloeothece citriformis]ACK70782.1 conserved hypothetical protein [Gloeothece citriformis PCC 7424]